MLFKLHDPEGCLTTTQQDQIRYALAFFEMWKNGKISPKKVKLDINGANITQIATAFADAIRHNVSVERVDLTLREFNEWENLREVFVALQESSEIIHIDIFTIYNHHKICDFHRIVWGEKYMLNYFCAILENPLTNKEIIIAEYLLNDFMAWNRKVFEL